MKKPLILLFLEPLDMKTINKTALLILLKVFDVLGLIPVRTVFVGTEETIVLNCTCFQENNGNWKGPNQSAPFFKFNETYLIQYAHGLHLNPKLEKTNVRVVGDYTKKKCNLLIEDFSTDNEGKYKCQYIENDITNIQVYEILLTYPPSNMNILHIQEGNTIQAIEGKSLVLVCNVQSGRPVEIMQWSSNGTVLKTGNKTITYRKIASLKDHMTTYTCSAFNSASKMPLAKHIRLDILGKPRTELNTSSFNGTNIQEGKLFTLCCITESNPPADNIIWIKDLQKIKSKSNSNNCVEFLPIYREHAGNYTCIAKNTIGSSSVRQSVRVLYPPDVVIHLKTFNDMVQLTCNAFGVPTEYRFGKWEHRSGFNEHIRYISGTHAGHLFIQKNKLQNSGIYICNVKNGVATKDGHLFQTSQISIQYEGPPIFVSFNDTVYSSPSDEYVVVELRIVSSFEILGTLETRMHSYEATETLYNSTCNEGLAFYGVNIGVVCTRLWFSLRLYETDNLTNVTATVCNRHGCTNRFIEIVSGKSHNDTRLGFVWISVVVILIAVLVSLGKLVYMKIQIRDRGRDENSISDLELRYETQGESVENRLYQTTDFLEQTEPSDRYRNSVMSTMSTQANVLTENETHAERSNVTRRTQNEETNMNYAEVVFEAAGPSTTKNARPFIHGAEDKTDYSEIDLSCRARLSALTSSSESDDDDFVYVDGIENYAQKKNEHVA